MLADTHCHLNFHNFDKDREQVIQRARENGLVKILIPGINLETSIEAVNLSENYQEVFAAVGIHPNEAFTWNETTKEDLRQLAKSNKVVAIGEIGLDYYRDKAPKELQIDVFQEQLDLAFELKLPVVIHSRNATYDNLNALQDIMQNLIWWIDRLKNKDVNLINHPGVLHSYSGDISLARLAIKNNLLIGISGPVTFKKAEILRSVVKNIEIDNLLIETDAPFLTPSPFRGKRNEPAYVKFIGEKIAEIKDMPYDFIKEQTTLNSERIFNW